MTKRFCAATRSPQTTPLLQHSLNRQPMDRLARTEAKRRRNGYSRTRYTSIRWVVCMLLAVLIVTLLPCSLASFAVTLVHDERECYAIRTPDRPTTLSGDFECWEERSDTRHMRSCRSISAWIDQRGKKRDVWRSVEDVSDAVFSVPVEGGQQYQLCFESSKPDNNRRRADDDEDDDAEYTVQLGFNIRVASVRALPDEELGPDAMRAVELLQAATQTEELWKNLADHFDFLRNREAVHRQLTRQINDRVMGWTIVEAVLVVVMAVCQVWYWKTFFEQRRFLWYVHRAEDVAR